ncbi:uncharacterized protein LOC128963394 [Oppia nitens]|uniref:uncharacterized protein LOC128963394 n=1 Tax=Oppia nitens TaxID=1686743 RepID=UPI0023DBD248|nr:uncharacterized protein LOC128963394 [Oppia nitens]
MVQKLSHRTVWLLGIIILSLSSEYLTTLTTSTAKPTKMDSWIWMSPNEWLPKIGPTNLILIIILNLISNLICCGFLVFIVWMILRSVEQFYSKRKHHNNTV